MPIYGLTDRGLSFPEIGSIRKGDRKEKKTRPNGSEYETVGKDLQYFRVEFDEQEAEAKTKFMQVYGARAAELNVFLPFDDIERMWNPYYEAYVAGGLVYRSDGRYVTYEINPATGAKVVVNGEPAKPHRPNPVGVYGSKNEPINAKATGRLKVIIPELARAAYLVVHTTSVHDIINLSDQLAALKAINSGRLAGIPLKLRRRPKQISTPSGEGGKRARRVKWLLSVEADPEWVAKMLTSVTNAALPAGYEIKRIASATVIEQGQPADFADAEVVDDDDETDEVLEAEPELVHEAEPVQEVIKQTAAKSSVTTNGKANIVIKTALWKDVSGAIALEHPEYANAYRLLHALEQEGVTEITNDNVQSLPSVIAKHIADKQAQTEQ